MSFLMTNSHKDQLLALINTANNIWPPIKAQEVTFSVPQDGSWVDNGKNYNSLVEMTFLPGFRSDPGVDVPFFYNRTPADQIVAISGKNPIFRDKGPGPFTSHSIIPWLNELYGLVLTTDDLVLTNGTPATTETYTGQEVHTAVTLDFTPSLRFSGSITVYFGAAIALQLTNLYEGPANMGVVPSDQVIADWAQLVDTTLPRDGFVTVAAIVTGTFDPLGTAGPVDFADVRIVKNDKSKVLIDVGCYTQEETGWWVVPSVITINGKRFAYTSHTAFENGRSPVPGWSSTATYTAEDGLPIEAAAGEYIYIYFGDEMLQQNPAP